MISDLGKLTVILALGVIVMSAGSGFIGYQFGKQHAPAPKLEGTK